MPHGSEATVSRAYCFGAARATGSRGSGSPFVLGAGCVALGLRLLRGWSDSAVGACPDGASSARSPAQAAPPTTARRPTVTRDRRATLPGRLGLAAVDDGFFLNGLTGAL